MTGKSGSCSQTQFWSFVVSKNSHSRLSLYCFKVCLRGYYLALEPHFPYRNGRDNAAPGLEEYTNRPPPKPRDVVLWNPIHFSLAQQIFSLPTVIDADQRSSRRAMSPLDPASTHSRCAS